MSEKKNPKSYKVIFTPGSFDQFEGTPEDLDKLVEEVQRLAESGVLFDDSNIVDIENLSEELQFTLLQHHFDKSKLQ
jgi:phosphoribosylanthranilate isomerase